MNENQATKLQSEFFECQCHSPEHTLNVTLDPEDGDLFITVFLGTWGFWKRLWIAIKYVFGYRSKYGDFDGGGIIKTEDLPRFIALLEKARDLRKVKHEQQADSDC